MRSLFVNVKRRTTSELEREEALLSFGPCGAPQCFECAAMHT
jgi:hypothetical protein